jgi:lipid-A-disaccharide synthase
MTRSRRFLAVAGEASGDLHGSGVVRALRQIDPACDVAGIGGDMMAAEGMRILFHCRDLSFMGFAEVVKNIPTIRRVEQLMRETMDREHPDALLLIDYPGLNLRLAAEAKKRHIPVVYYISPQVWAWHKSRVRKIARLVRKMNVVFPFEVPLYRQAGVDVEFVGHPLVERLKTALSREEFFRRHGLDPERPLVALLPGSRRQEIQRMVPVMGAAAELLGRERKNVQCGLGVAPNLGRMPVEALWPQGVPVTFIEHGTYDLMAYADVAIVTSGTATLETGWFGTPLVVVYATSPLSYAIGRMLVEVDAIGLVNIVAGSNVAPEFIQGEMTPANIALAAARVLDDPAYAKSVRESLAIIKSRLGLPGASERVARSLMEVVEVS